MRILRLMDRAGYTSDFFNDAILPITALSFMMASLCKPKRTDFGYKLFLYSHYFSCLIINEALSAYVEYQKDNKHLVAREIIKIFQEHGLKMTK